MMRQIDRKFMMIWCAQWKLTRWNSLLISGTLIKACWLAYLLPIFDQFFLPLEKNGEPPEDKNSESKQYAMIAVSFFDSTYASVL